MTAWRDFVGVLLVDGYPAALLAGAGGNEPVAPEP